MDDDDDDEEVRVTVITRHRPRHHIYHLSLLLLISLHGFHGHDLLVAGWQSEIYIQNRSRLEQTQTECIIHRQKRIYLKL